MCTAQPHYPPAEGGSVGFHDMRVYVGPVVFRIRSVVEPPAAKDPSAVRPAASRGISGSAFGDSHSGVGELMTLGDGRHPSATWPGETRNEKRFGRMRARILRFPS
jgi:hypothetical protein